MISIRKQLFTIFISVGCIMVLTTSLIVNVSIKRNFENYVQDNVQEAKQKLVAMVARLSSDGELVGDLVEKNMIENYLGDFVVTVLNPDKSYVWGETKEELIDSLNEKYPAGIDENLYMQEERPVYNNDNEIVAYVVIGYYPSDILSKNDLAFTKNVNMSIVWCSSIILMWFILSGLYVSRLFTYHIYGISRTSISLADGKLKARYPFKSKIKEIETLRHSMNYLGDKLQKQDEIRKKLVSDISHEIRTPLHILQSNLEAMIDGIYPIDEEQMNVLYQEVVRFGKLLNNLNLLKDVEENDESKELSPININDSIREVFDAFKIVAKEKEMSYYIKDNETQNVMIMGDKDSLKQLWMNLLSNAFKFSDEKGQIRVWTYTEGNECIIYVEDHGIGIATEDLPYVFERMYRGDKSREKYQGSGIGLTMVKNIVDRHEGKISIDSIEGEYTRIKVSIPIHFQMLEPNSISNKVRTYMKLTKN